MDVGGKTKKDSGVKKLILISVYPGVPEVYSNVRTLLEDLNIEALDFSITADLKMRKYILDWYSKYRNG